MWLANDNPGPSLRPRSAADAAVLFGTSFATYPIETFKAAHLDGEGRVIAITEQTGLHDTVLQVDARGLVTVVTGRGDA